MKQIRTLKPDEIEVRVGTIKDTGISLLLYKNARCDMSILDETFGIMGWKREHEMIDKALFCTVSIRDENGEWVSKQDVGVQSYAEPTKGMASDAFKRACFNIGIGRELYTAPRIWVPIERVYIIKEDGKVKVKDTFHVSYISYDNEGKVIQCLEIRNQYNKIVYQKKVNNQTAPQSFPSCEAKKISEMEMNQLYAEMQRTGVTEQDIMERYPVPLANLTERDYRKIMSALKKTGTRVG